MRSVIFYPLSSAWFDQTRAVPPAEGAVEGEDEEQRPVRTEETHQHPQMEMSGGDKTLASLLR